MVQVWDLKDLGLQASQRIAQASDPLRLLTHISQNFPTLAASISRLPVNASLAAQVRSNQRSLPPGAPRLAHLSCCLLSCLLLGVGVAFRGHLCSLSFGFSALVGPLCCLLLVPVFKIGSRSDNHLPVRSQSPMRSHFVLPSVGRLCGLLLGLCAAYCWPFAFPCPSALMLPVVELLCCTLFWPLCCLLLGVCALRGLGGAAFLLTVMC